MFRPVPDEPRAAWQEALTELWFETKNKSVFPFPKAGQRVDQAIKKPVLASLHEWLASPEYVAVIVWTPSVRSRSVVAAEPFARLTVIGAAAPSWKVTDPVGTLPTEVVEATIAVKVTYWPGTELLADETSETVVEEIGDDGALTVSKPLPLAAVKLTSPAKA